jgi:microcystin-dependent protein
MPSTYTTNGGLEKPGDGEQSGDWGDTVNINMDIIDVITNGQVTLSLSGTSSTLSTSNAVLSDGQNALIILGGTPSGTHTITIDPSDAEKIYFVYNTTAQSVVFTQGSGGNVTIATGDSAIIYSNGGGASAAVANLTDHFAMSSVKITGGAINGTPIGATSASTGAFSTLSSSGLATLSSLTTASATISGGTVNGTPIGGSTPSTGAFTTASTSGAATLASAVLNGQLGLGGANYGTAGQVVVSQGAGSAPAWGSGFPSGGIVLWSGSIASIPSGWLLCNGTSGTPDLRDRFVVGAGTTYAVGATGGAASVTLSTSEIPSHTHTFSGTTDTVGDHTHVEQNFSSNGTGDGSGPGASCCGGSIENSGVTTLGAGSHNHTVSGTTGSAGSGGSHENRPPYYALAYIMKS